MALGKSVLCMPWQTRHSDIGTTTTAASTARAVTGGLYARQAASYPTAAHMEPARRSYNGRLHLLTSRPVCSLPWDDGPLLRIPKLNGFEKSDAGWLVSSIVDSHARGVLSFLADKDEEQVINEDMVTATGDPDDPYHVVGCRRLSGGKKSHDQEVEIELCCELLLGWFPGVPVMLQIASMPTSSLSHFGRRREAGCLKSLEAGSWAQPATEAGILCKALTTARRLSPRRSLTNGLTVFQSCCPVLPSSLPVKLTTALHWLPHWC